MNLLLSDTSMEIYTSIIDYNPDAIFILSVDGKIIEVNQVVTKRYGYTKEEMQGKNYQDIIVPDHLESTNQYFAQALQGSYCEYETQVFHKSGEIVHLLVKNIPLTVNGKIVGIFGTAIDQTELYKTKASLIKLEEKFKAVFDSTVDAMYLLDVEGNVIEVNPAFEELYGWKREEVIGKPLSIVPHDIVPQYHNMIDRVFRGEKINGIETTRIRKDGTTIEVSVTLSAIRDENVDIVGVSGIERDITKKQKQLEASLKENKERYKQVLEFLPKGVIIHRNGIILYTNSTALKMTKEENTVGKRMTDYIHPKYHEIFQNRLAQTVEDQQAFPMTEFKWVRVGGEVIDMEVHSTTIDFDGERYVLTVVEDITGRKQMERVLKESQQNLEVMNKALNESSILAITNRKGIIEFANDKFFEISQYSKEELIGQDHRILNSGYHSKEFFQDMWKTIGSGETWKGEIQNKAKDGTFYWVDTTIVPFLNAKGKTYRYASIRNDITVRKQAEEALYQSEKRYRTLVELSPHPIVVHTDGIIRYVNQAGVKVFGLQTLEKYIGTPVLHFVHPDCREKIIERMKEVKKEGHTVELMEEKIIRPDGSILDVEVAGVGIIYEGNPSAQLIFHDITARKQVEEALRESEEKYRLIAENMTDLVSIVDWNGFFKYASPSHVTVLGFPAEAYEGNLARNWMHQDEISKVRHQLEDMVKIKEGSVFEFRYRDIKGDWIWLEAKATPIFNKEGHFKHFLVVSREISERKMYEEKLTHKAYHDTLTGLPNRRMFKERLKQSLKDAEKYNRKMAVMYMDMDKFKNINDTFGHDVGDELLKQFAQRVKGCLRESDTLARQGGDEFTILLPEIQGEKSALQIANRILSSFQEHWQIGKHVFQTTSSIGIAFYPKDGMTRHELVKSADTALYEAKESGRNNYKTYS